MIPASSPRKNVPAWQRELGRAVRDPRELCRLLELEPPPTPAACSTPGGFPIRVPRPFVARMRAGDSADPLLRQVLPGIEEDRASAGYGPDPVGDHAAMMRPGVLHKYHGRVLLTVTGACAVHCRYCFRREFPYAEANPRHDAWSDALAYIAADSSIREVILSGGDPLSLIDPILADLAERIAAIDHVDTLRLHTRLPVVLPSRVDAALTGWLGGGRLATVVVIHANHAREIDHEVGTAIAGLRATGATVLNQAVLLRGVNDDAEAIADLSRRLFAQGVLPYYLHMLDPVRGAAHFAVGERRARRIMAAVAARLPGYLVPRLVRENAGMPGKTPVAPDWGDAGVQDPDTHPPVSEAAGRHQP